MTVRERLTALGLTPDIFAREFVINPDELAVVLDSEDFPCISDHLTFLEKTSELMVNIYVLDVIQSEKDQKYKRYSFIVFDDNEYLWKYFPRFRGIPSCVHKRNIDKANHILKRNGLYASIIQFSPELYSNWLEENKVTRDDWLTLMEWATEQRGPPHRDTA